MDSFHSWHALVNSSILYKANVQPNCEFISFIAGFGEFFHIINTKLFFFVKHSPLSLFAHHMSVSARQKVGLLTHFTQPSLRALWKQTIPRPNRKLHSRQHASLYLNTQPDCKFISSRLGFVEFFQIVNTKLFLRFRRVIKTWLNNFLQTLSSTPG